MLFLAVLLQMPPADSIYATPALREFVARAAIENRAPPLTLEGYRARAETEFAFVLRDTIGRELTGQIEQLAARAEWERDGRYDLHVVGYRSQSLGAPYSALTFTRMYSVPTLYGNRLVVGMNDGVPLSRDDSIARRKRIARDSAAGREQLRAVHPLAEDRDRFYTFRGGDTAATLYAAGRAIRIVRVHVEPRRRPDGNFYALEGELDFDADRHQLVRIRARLVRVGRAPSTFARGTGAVAIAYLELENAEIAGQYWLPHYQRSEFQAQMGLMGETRAIYRIVTRFRDYTLDTLPALAASDTPPPRLEPTRAKLSFAGGDSVSRYGEWTENLGIASGRVAGDDFADLAPDVWKATGSPRLRYWPARMEDIVRSSRVEGLFTGAAASLHLRDRAPGLSLRGHAGYAWSQETVRGAASVAYARGQWANTLRAERMLASTNDFMSSLETGLSITPLITGVDEHDYVDRWLAGITSTRVVGDVDRALLTTDVAFVRDRPEVTRVARGPFRGPGHRFRDNRVAWPGEYARASVALELHPRVTGEALTPGLGGRIEYTIAHGDLDWQRVLLRVAGRQYWRGLTLASRLDAGAVFGATLPPQSVFELGGTTTLPSYEYKEFGGDRAALGRGLVAYHFPVLRTPRRMFGLVLPGLSPGLGAGAQAGWAEASSDAARAALLALGGDGTTPLSRPTGRIRSTADIRLTFLGGALGFGLARPIDSAGPWKPFFLWGAAF